MFMLVAGKEVAEWVFSQSGRFISPSVTGLGWATDKLTAAVAVEDYNGHNLFIHQRIDKSPPRSYWYAVADYCFNQLGCSRVSTHVQEDNFKALRLNKHVGFETEAILKGASSEGKDILIQVIWKDKCKLLEWKR